MLYLIGLGLNVDGISKFGLEAVKKCKKIYLENYTVDFPYSLKQLEEVIGKKIVPADREFVEGLSIVDEAKRKDVALLIYGSPLTATTHISLIQEAKLSKTKHKIIYGASILDGIAETGLQIYKFGKIASLPAWKKSFEPDSFMEIVKENKSINAHSLILVDIGLEHEDALRQLEISAKNHGIKLGKIVLCQNIGVHKGKVFYRTTSELKELSEVKKPYCIIIPGKLHFVEKEFLENFN